VIFLAKRCRHWLGCFQGMLGLSWSIRILREIEGVQDGGANSGGKGKCYNTADVEMREAILKYRRQ